MDVITGQAMSEQAIPAPAAPKMERPREDLLRVCLGRMAERSQEALSELYDRTSRFVYGIALRVLGNTADAEEVTLDVYSQVWRSAENFHAGTGTSPGLVDFNRSQPRG